MEYHAEHPRSHPKIREDYIVFAQGVGGGYARGDFGEAILMCEEVKKGEEHGERLLHA